MQLSHLLVGQLLVRWESSLVSERLPPCTVSPRRQVSMSEMSVADVAAMVLEPLELGMHVGRFAEHLIDGRCLSELDHAILCDRLGYRIPRVEEILSTPAAEISAALLQYSTTHEIYQRDNPCFRLALLAKALK